MSLHVHVVLGLPILLHVPYRQFLFYYDFFLSYWLAFTPLLGFLPLHRLS